MYRCIDFQCVFRLNSRILLRDCVPPSLLNTMQSFLRPAYTGNVFENCKYAKDLPAFEELSLFRDIFFTLGNLSMITWVILLFLSDSTEDSKDFFLMMDDFYMLLEQFRDMCTLSVVLSSLLLYMRWTMTIFLWSLIPLIWISLIIWFCGLIVGAIGQLFRMYCVQRANRYLWHYRVLTAQGDVLCKDDNRAKYRKNKDSKVREHSKVTRSRAAQNKRKKPPLRGPYDPQMGTVSVAATFAKIANINGIPLDDATLNRVENLGALFMAVKDCTTVSGFLSTLFLYMKTHYSLSVANIAADYLSEILDAKYDAQSGTIGVSPQDEKPPWLMLLRELQDNWTLVVHNEGFAKLSHVLSLCLALGLCDSAALDFKIAGMKLFSIGAFNKHASAVDLADAVFETVSHFVEGGYACFERKSIKPLLYGNMENEEFEDAYAKSMRCHEYARCGNLEKYENMSENDYEALLYQCIEKAGILITSCKGPVEKNVLRRKLDMLRHWQSTFRQTRVQGGLKVTPYSIGVFGGTSVGKSTIANILMITTLQHNGYCAKDDRIVTINESDKYLSNYRSHTNGVLVDDIGNTKAEFVEKAPTALMIQLVNNVRMYANMAEADMKGKISVEPKVVIATKNVKDSCAHIYSNEPASVTRRDRITLTCTVKPEFAVHDMLNEDRVREAFPAGTPQIPNLWDITVEKSFPIPNPIKGKPSAVGWEIVRDAYGKQLKDINLTELIRWVGQDSRKMFAFQEEFVEKSNNLADKIVLCKRCNHQKPDVCICEEEQYTYVPKIDERCCSSGYCSACEGHHDENAEVQISESLAREASLDATPELLSREESDDTFEDCQETERVYDDQFGQQLIYAVLPRYRRWNRWFRPSFTYWTEEIERLSVEKLLERLDWLETSRWVRWTNWVPEEWLTKDWLKNVIWFTRERELRNMIRTSYLNHLILIGVCIFASIFVSPIFLIAFIFPLMGISGVVEFEKKRMYDEVAADNKAMPAVFQKYRDNHIKWITGTCLVIAALYAIAQVYKAFKVIPNPQGNLAPTTMKEISLRDEEVNPWSGVIVSPMPCSEKAKTTTPDRLEQMVQDNLCFMDLRYGDGERIVCDAFFPKSNVALIPKHVWKADDMKAKFTRHDPTKIGGNFECFLYRKQSVDIPDTDLSLVWIPNGGDWKDLSDYLPLERFKDVPARLTHKQPDGSCVGSKLYMTVDEVTTKTADYFGAHYELCFETFNGLCMSTIITETKGPLIGGFHLGGEAGTGNGCSGLLLKKELDTAFKQLKKKSGVVLAKSAGTIPKQLYDVQFYQGNEVHAKSPINYLPEGTNCKYYGQVTGRASYHSTFEETIISKHVADVCDCPQKWGPPKFRTGYPWQASLQHSTKPSCGIEGSLLDKATEDYKAGIIRELENIPDLKMRVKPLSEMETVCGIDGLRFIDKMPPATSIGFPLSGPKSHFLTLCEPEDYPSHQCPALLERRFWDQAEEMEATYLAGERCYPIFKACLKDEPTKLDKDKVRVFQGAPIALQLMVRKYFLPVARILSMLPLTSECAVGINSQGPEWDQLANHVKKYGSERILAGDYSKYDLRMPAQVMFSAFRILMDIAEHCGYSERDLKIMEGIATDICYPLMAYNGDLIQHIGSNPSGQNLTVYINSIVNALLFRCAYYDLTQNRINVPEFRDVCALITYGDDAKSSVREDFPEFNHIAVANFLEAHDMKFTMPDKHSDPVPYMIDEEADLLQRSNVYNEDTGLIMGALGDDSIFKSLHGSLKSKALTKEQQSMTNIDGALREWFSHGREVYEERRSQMIEVAKRANISHGCKLLHSTYDDMLETWKEKYM